MKILFALNHPAHYYLFKYVIKGLESKGHQIFIVIKDKDILEKLLIEENVKYFKLSYKRKVKSAVSIVSKGFVELIVRDYRLLKFVKKNKPEILLGTDIAITHVGKLLGIPSIVFNEDDYEINKIFCNFSYPFATNIVAPINTSVGKYTSKKIAYNGIQKIAYLHPNYFKPKSDVLSLLTLNTEQRFVLIRLVSLTAGHDIESQHKGITTELLNKIIEKLIEKEIKVFITSENKLPPKYSQYELKVDKNKIHDVLSYAEFFIGDSQSMAVEAAILGTPGIRFNDFVGKINVLEELEHKYKLTFGIKTNEPEKLLKKIDVLLNTKDLKAIFQQRRNKLLNDKIDVTAFMVWFIENYPESAVIMKDNPDYQYKFK